ncbi:ABC transporter ATP binding protein [Methanocella paludicola SANAE]|uniref:ABC transporter ATP binding protein n=1 Tax=Methanocella paludicola (strain DSM 17711 / JCM 13418 / NBRC 101707 / SANAE) TaxID=304371 RepID=D1YX86_METPS|nr:ABC transporter ATP-binding protein [Methanocella paludicola]BAI61058.1 ABC transporter ATP binding protein [Methanocella paludicola SANAE]
MIRTESLTKVYNKVKAVDSIDINIEKGQVCGFVGPNGAGKTTTIGMLAGLIEPTGGKCFIKDIEVARNPIQIKRMIGYLPEGVGFYSNLSARQNLRYLAKFYGLKDAESEARITELLEYAGLKNVDKPAGAFSRGMRQRLGLARALLNDPEVIFLDEPTNGLDPEGVIQFRKIIKEQAAKGKTIFFSSHILDEVEHVCNTICIISKGKIVTQGSLDDVRNKMHKDKPMTIKIKVIGMMPKLTDPGIIDATYNDGSATLRVQSDIVNEVASELMKSGVRIRELKVEEESLEDIFLETVYRRE